MVKTFFILLLGAFLFSCDTDPEEIEINNETESATPPSPKKSFFEVTVSENGAANFGYQILQDGVMIINQTTIPSVPGTNGFTTREKAQTAGEYILAKIENGTFPPTVSPQELDSLGVLN